jgi:hypothetical protein
MSTKRSRPAAPHPDDGDLIRLVDAECTDVERGQMEVHLAACDVCAARHVALVRRTRQVHEMLAAGDTAPDVDAQPNLRAPRPWWRTRRVRIALRAAVLLIAVGVVGAGAQTARTWMQAHWPQVREALRRQPTGTRPVAPLASSTAVHFNPDRPTLTIEVSARQAAGTMVIDIVSDTLATVVITPSTSDAAVLVLPEMLRIANRPAMTTNYVIHVPTRVKVVEVRIASQSMRRLVSKPGARWALDLRAPSR